MRKVTIALGSFAVGAMFSFVGIQTSMRLQPVSAQEAPSKGGVINVRAIPVVSPLKPGPTFTGGKFTNIPVQLDGLDMKGGTFTGVTFVYGGGAYRLENASVVPPVRFQLTGAAANTAVFLNMFGMLGCPAKRAPNPKPNQPMMNAANVTAEMTTDLISPYGQ